MKIIHFDIKTKISNVYIFRVVCILFTRWLFLPLHFLYYFISCWWYFLFSSTDGFDTVSEIHVCVSRSVLIISTFLFSSCCKKKPNFLKHFTWFFSFFYAIKPISNQCSTYGKTRWMVFTSKMSLFHRCSSKILLVKTNYLVST